MLFRSHAYAGLMQRLNHLLHLAYAAGRIGSVRSVRPLRHVVVLRVITPVVLRLLRMRFIHRSIVVARQNLHVGHTQFYQMVYTRLQSFGAAGAVLRER